MSIRALVTLFACIQFISFTSFAQDSTEEDNVTFVEVPEIAPQASSVNLSDFIKEKNNIVATPSLKLPLPITNAPNFQGNGLGCPSYFNNTECQVLLLTNKERAKYGLQALVGSQSCYNVAKKHTQNMVNQNFFDHRNFSQRLNAEGISGGSENIAKGQRSPEEVLNSWMNSSGHRKNILDPRARSLGVGQVGVTWTQCFSYQ